MAQILRGRGVTQESNVNLWTHAFWYHDTIRHQLDCFDVK